MAQATVLKREVVPDPSDPDGVKLALRVTYSTATRAPRWVFVPGETPSEEEVAEAIRQDLLAQRDEEPTPLEI